MNKNKAIDVLENVINGTFQYAMEKDFIWYKDTFLPALNFIEENRIEYMTWDEVPYDLEEDSAIRSIEL